jgi:hypothetical protein
MMMTVSIIATERRRSRFGAIYSTLIDVYFVSFRVQYINFTHASLGNLAESRPVAVIPVESIVE